MYTAKQVKLQTIVGPSVAVTEAKRKPVINTGRGTPFSGIIAATTGDIFFDVSASLAYWWNGSAWQNFNRFTDEVRIGTTAQRPANPDVGLIWLNTTTEKPEWYTGAAGGWKTFASEIQTIGASTYNLRTGLSGLFLWLDFSDSDSVTVNGGLFTKINEKSVATSSNFSTLTSAVIPYQRRFYNNLGMLMGYRTAAGGFSGSLRSTVSINQNATVFIVHGLVRSVANDWGYPMLEIWDSNSTGRLSLYANNFFGLKLFGDYSKCIPTTGSVTTGSVNFALTPPTVSGDTWLTPCITTYVISPTGLQIFFNGTLMSTATVTTGVASVNQYRVNTGNNQHGVTNYGEIIATNSALTAAKRQEVEGYLAWKWGIQSKLPNGHTGKSAAPSN